MTKAKRSRRSLLALLVSFLVVGPTFAQPAVVAGKAKTDQCDADCAARAIGLIAVPASSALVYKKIMDEYQLAETVVYTGLPGQPMTAEEIQVSMQKIRESKAFERRNQVVVDQSAIDFISGNQLESKLELYAAQNKGVSRIAIRNPRLLKGGGLAAAIGSAILLLELYDGPAVSKEQVVEDLDSAKAAITPIRVSDETK